MATSLTPDQIARYHEDQRRLLYDFLGSCLILANAFVLARYIVRYRIHYSPNSWMNTKVYLEDIFRVLSAVFMNAMLVCMIIATSYGLGLHSRKINAEDHLMPRNLSNVFEFVWLAQIMSVVAFAFIKFALLFIHRQLFTVYKNWLHIAWFDYFTYSVISLVSCTAFDIFQCSLTQWFYMKYYAEYHFQPPYPIDGQCLVEETFHVATPFIIGLIPDAVILCIGLTVIWGLNLSWRAKLRLMIVCCLGFIACGLNFAGIALALSTYKTVDPSYGLVGFFVLTICAEIFALGYAYMPTVDPQILEEIRQSRRSAPSVTTWTFSHTYLLPMVSTAPQQPHVAQPASSAGVLRAHLPAI